MSSMNWRVWHDNQPTEFYWVLNVVGENDFAEYDAHQIADYVFKDITE